MAEHETVTILLRDDHGDATLEVRQHLATSRAPETRGRDEVPTMVEGARYEFSVQLDGDDVVDVQPSELFQRSAASAARGVLETGWAVGDVTVTVSTVTGRELRGTFSVRAAKFSQEEDFATMVNDLSRVAVEALHLGFAPSAGQYQASLDGVPRLDYQRFAVLHSLLRAGDLRMALEYITARTYRTWVPATESRRPGQPLPGSSRLASQFASAQRRVLAPRTRFGTVPAVLTVERTEETFDNPPNRWTKSVLEEWRLLALRIREAGRSLGAGPAARAIREADWVIELLDEVLITPAWASVAPSRQSVGDNYVLRRGQGYQTITSAAAVIDMAMQLDVDEDPFHVSRRSVATLYEYWTFVRLALAVAAAFETTPPLDQLFRQDDNGLSLALKAGRAHALSFRGHVQGAPVHAELFFNRTFGSGASWTNQMRPDASLVVKNARGPGTAGGPATPHLWVHFDAKYKVDWLDAGELLESCAETPDSLEAGEAKRSDLLKMHAYKDAVYGTAGAYILFPGTRHVTFNEASEEEALPGIGAFGLRPASADADTDHLQAFISRLLRHVVRSGTRHARLERWTVEALEGASSRSFLPRPPGEPRPPHDTLVMWGHVRSEEHEAWVDARGWYNVRADQGRAGFQQATSNHLHAEWIVLYQKRGAARLYRRRGGWTIMDRADLTDLGYPQPRGRTYFVCRVERVDGYAWTELIQGKELDRMTNPRAPEAHVGPEHPYGAPFSTTWLDVMEAAERGRAALEV